MAAEFLFCNSSSFKLNAQSGGSPMANVDEELLHASARALLVINIKTFSLSHNYMLLLNSILLKIIVFHSFYH